MNPIEGDVMLKRFRKNKTSLVTVRSEDLLVGDQLVYDMAVLEVLDITPGTETTNVRLEMTHPNYAQQTRRVSLYNELLCSVTR
jgi:hypothetical protein